MAGMIRPILLVALLCTTPLASAALAQTEGESSTVPDSGSATPAPRKPSIGLDSLLRPRTGTYEPIPVQPSDEHGGRGEAEWRKLFSEAHSEEGELEIRVSEAQEKVRASSGQEWGYTPAGTGMPTDPEMLKLRAELKRDRQSLEAARTRLRDLDVEASLAGVPDSWREPVASEE